MTILQALTDVFVLYEKSNDEIDVTSEDFLVRLTYANISIRKWENEEGVNWKELYGLLDDALVDGELALEEDFNRPSSFLSIGTDKYDYIRPEQVQQELMYRPSRKFYYITGGRGNKVLHVNPSISANFLLPYQKYATTFVTGLETTQIEMADPDYLTHDVLTQLYLDDENDTEASVKVQVANAKMSSMKLANEAPVFFQGNALSDSADNQGTAFGR